MATALSVNYKSQSHIAADLIYLKQIGFQSIRIHIPAYANPWPGAGASYNNWRTTAQQFKQAGFYTSFGLTGTMTGVTSGISYQNYHDSIVSEAQYCEQNGYCDEFEIGNELEIHGLAITSLSSTGTTATAVTQYAHGYTTGMTINIYNCVPSGYNGIYTITVVNTTTFTYTLSGSLGSVTTLGIVNDLNSAQINANLRTIATDVKAVYSGQISYAASNYTSSNNDWIANGKGNLDYLMSNLYSGYNTNFHTFFKGHVSAAIAMQQTFGSGWKISEFGVEADSTKFPLIPDDLIEQELISMIAFFRSINVSLCHLYQYRSYKDNDSNDTFFLRYNDDTFRTGWNAMIGGRRVFI